MTQKYFTGWTIYTQTCSGAFQQALTDNQIDAGWAVWRGPSGDALVTDEFPDDEEYADYIESGNVEDYLHDED
jgi:hypothetical protein